MMINLSVAVVLLYCQLTKSEKRLRPNESKVNFFDNIHKEEAFVTKVSDQLNRGKEQIEKLKDDYLNTHQKPDVSFHIKFENKIYQIDLNLKAMVTKSFSVISYSEHGQELMKNKKPKRNCYYQGKVRGIFGSTVFANLCNGLHGYIIFPSDFLILTTNINGIYVLLRLSQVKSASERSFCMLSGHFNDTKNKKPSTFFDFSRRLIQTNKSPIRSKPTKKFVELVVVADKKTYQIHGSVPAVVAFIKEVVNIVDGFYRELGVRIILSQIEVWNDKDRIEFSLDARVTLTRLRNYHLHRLFSESLITPWASANAVHILHGASFRELVLGIATYDSMCEIDSLGISNSREDTWETATVVAHEIGHTFGMIHDYSSCYCPSGHECIMADRNRFNSLNTWSSCSRTKMKNFLSSKNAECLSDIPNYIFDHPVCGNDIVETDEECDCGGPSYCRDSCCNPRTCKNNTNTQCKEGKCCYNCRFATKNTECRLASGECDLPDFCTGNHSECPQNLYKENGSPCNNNTAYCYNGTCITHKHLCRNLWGIEAAKASNLCYDNVNKRGLPVGNCGYNSNGGYVKCRREDVSCGTLLCTGGRSNSTVHNTAIVNVTITDYEVLCKAILIEDTNNYNLELALVSDGVICGEGKICFNHKCQEKPPLTCTRSCSGNGVCNNLGKCHCHGGWAPPFCNLSIESTLTHSKFAKKASRLLIIAAIMVGINSVLFLFGCIVGFRYSHIRIHDVLHAQE